jgi:hypothetical protein
MSDSDKSGFHTVAAIFSSAGVGSLVGFLTSSKGLGLAFGGVGLILSGILYFFFEKDIDAIGWVFALGMFMFGVACVTVGLASL